MDKRELNHVKRPEKLTGRVKRCKEIAHIDYTQWLPVELLAKIFTLMYHQHETSQEDIAKLREVCKRWCEVIDDNIGFYAHLNSRTLHGPTMSHVRVKTCSVSDFHKASPPNQRLFRDPKYIGELLFKGKVSRKNFLWLIGQLSKLDYVTISPQFLQHSNTILIPTNADDESTIAKFWANIEVIEIVAVQIFRNKNLNVPRNLTRILSADMPSLNCLKILGQWSLDLYSSIISFLLRHPLVNKFHLVLDDLKRPLIQNSSPEIQDFRNIQLKNILYTTHCAGKEGHRKIMAFIKSQRSLEELYIISFTNVCIDVIELRDFFIFNKSTLTSLYLCDIVLRETLDASLFKSLTYLKKLTLGKGGYAGGRLSENSFFPAIANLTSLPGSLERLDIRNLSCVKQELYNFVVSKQFENLRKLYLRNVGNDILTPNFVDCLVIKKGMQKVILSRLDLSRFQVMERENKKFIVAKNGYFLPVSTNGTTLQVKLSIVNTI